MNVIYETIMRKLLASGGTTRRQIASETRLSPVTVHRYLKRMLKAGAIEIAGEIRPPTGRPADVYRAVIAAADLPVIYVSPTNIHAGIYRPGKGLSARKTVRLPRSLERAKTLAAIRKTGETLKRHTGKLPGIAVTG
ncbi:MAG TPA: winged helix-turn-helix domain-containing protein, partial [Planctomycetes bacterium]|nr:winged helix-turn-helix domain-containing protein [Planctomycetota bacterium]